jgi:hypothetical protein
MVSNNSQRTGCIYPFNPSFKERPMRRAIEVSLLALAFSTLNIGLSVTGFAQDEAGQENVIKKSVDLSLTLRGAFDNRCLGLRSRSVRKILPRRRVTAISK